MLPLLLFFASLSYVIALYQQRRRWIGLSVIFACFTLPLFGQHRLLLFALSLLLPLASSVVHKLMAPSWSMAQSMALPKQRIEVRISWEWPLLICALMFGILFVCQEWLAPVSIIQQWLAPRLSIPLAVTFGLVAIALSWYASAVQARAKWQLVIATGFALVALFVPDKTFMGLAWFAPLTTLFAFCVSRVTERDWVIPIYIIAVVAAVMMGIDGFYQGVLMATSWSLLIFAIVLYMVGVMDDAEGIIWIAPFFAFWSLFLAGWLGDLYRPVIIALICAVVGTAMRSPIVGSIAAHFGWQKRLSRAGLPLYATAMAAAILTGVSGMLGDVNRPFFAAVPTVLLLYALVAYGIVLVENKRNTWQWLVAVLVFWGLLLTPQTTTCFDGVVALNASAMCSAQVQMTYFWLAGIALVMGGVALLAGHSSRRNSTPQSGSKALVARFGGTWSLYLASFSAMFVAFGWWTGSRMAMVEGSGAGNVLLPLWIALPVIGVLIAFGLTMMLVERMPELLIVPVLLILGLIFQLPWDFIQQMLACSLLCVLIFATQFLWKAEISTLRLLPSGYLERIVAIGGQVLVVLAIVLRGGYFFLPGSLAHTGTAVLLVLAGLIGWFGYLEAKTIYYYSVGLLVALAVSQTMAAFGPTRLEVLLLSPASYLLVIAPFLAKSRQLANPELAGRLCSIVGAILLLFPMLWASFEQDNLRSSLLLVGESFVLIMLGLMTRMPFWSRVGTGRMDYVGSSLLVYSGAAMVIVSGIRLLFVAAPGLSIPLLLTLSGLLLLVVATGLALIRRRFLTQPEH